jgi:hypothetical protein
MLPPFIIEQIRQREEQERRRREEMERPRLQLPVDAYWPRREKSEEDHEDEKDAPDRGVAILEF